jgi:hypothetical protein
VFDWEIDVSKRLLIANHAVSGEFIAVIFFSTPGLTKAPILENNDNGWRLQQNNENGCQLFSSFILL